MTQKIYLGADHAGWERKEKVKEWLAADGLAVEDLSNPELNQADDYPDVAFRVSERVVGDEEALGILICGSGIGMCMAANKVKGIRAATVYNVWAAEASRKDNNANVLCLPGRVLDDEEEKEIIKVWLVTNFSGEERHKRRIKKINSYV
ncbi:MAG: RpiB/LacA/LacB family sugar-phosphate isomerase [Patescibacteria group bacterium]|jgi:RpiB/LacA/LacB family sugar-phosphate isomerase